MKPEIISEKFNTQMLYVHQKKKTITVTIKHWNVFTTENTDS